MASESEDIKAMVDGLGTRFATVEKQLARMAEWTPSELAAAVRRAREQVGLPVTSELDLLINYGVPLARAQDALTRDPSTQGMVLAARLGRGEGRILILASNAGRGKSTAAAYALTFRPGLWVNSPQLARIDDGEPGTVRDSDMLRAELLVIDDVGTEHSPGGFAASRLNHVVTVREGMRKPTLITTNLETERFKTVYGDRIASRANADDEPLGWHTLDGPDLRSPGTPEQPQPLQLRAPRHFHAAPPSFNERGEK